jgi:DNA-binding NtrC family response regulator
MRRALTATVEILSLLVERALIFPLGAMLQDIGDQTLIETLAALKEHRSNTARLLGISRRALYNRLHATRRTGKAP